MINIEIGIYISIGIYVTIIEYSSNENLTEKINLRLQHVWKIQQRRCNNKNVEAKKLALYYAYFISLFG